MKAETLRKSILQYAIQGKLVPQIASEEPARELLQKIKAEKDELIQQGKLYKKKNLLTFSEKDFPFEIPDNWSWCYLSDVSIIQEGAGIRKFQYRDKGIQLFSVTNILEGDIDLNKKQIYVSQEEYSNKYTHLTLNKGDIVTACSGGSWGKTAIYDENDIVMLNTSTLRMRFFSDLSNNIYLYYLTKSFCFKNQIEKQLSGMQPNFGYAHYSKVLIPLPPLEEQKRIVSRIEELMLLVDEYEKKQIELEKLEKDFPEKLKKSVLQYAIQGKLVPQIDTEKPASELLKKIKAEKDELIQQKKIKEPKPLPPITEDEKPFEIPDSWEWVRLGNVGEVNPRNTLEDEINVSFIPMTLINDKYQNTFSFEVRKWKDVKKGFTHFRNSDVVVAKIVPCFQNLKSAVMRGLENGHGAGTTELHILRQNELHIEPSLLLWFVKSPYFILNGEQIMTGTAGQQRVSTDYVKTVLFPLPPLDEQKRIVSHIEELFKLVDLLSSGGKLEMEKKVRL